MTKPDIHPQSPLGKQLSGAAESVTKTVSPHHTVVEFVTYDPEDYDTYPSVCQDPQTVLERFGFKGGEKLVFTAQGMYLGQLTKEIGRLEHQEHTHVHTIRDGEPVCVYCGTEMEL
jgi:hypothetical protein